MSERKQFKALSKSQRNRRIRKLCNSSYAISDSNVYNIENNAEVTIAETSEQLMDHLSTNSETSVISTANIQIMETNTEVDGQIFQNNPEYLLENVDNAFHDISLSANAPQSMDRDIKKELAGWVCRNNITHDATRSLLKILNDIEHPELSKLPLDPRTLLGTPDKTALLDIPPGKYFHYGLEKAVTDQLKVIDMNKISDNIRININIDGLPLAKSSKSQFWPILAEIYPIVTVPFVIGVYHGYNKPHSSHALLEEFLHEYKILHEEGFEFSNRKFKVNIRAVICDTPARSFVTCTKGHNGYFGCSKCTQEGEYEDHRMLFPDMHAQLRTDDNFTGRINDEHHTGKSGFEESGLKMVSQFPLDYMHLVCLGVLKKILQTLIKGIKINGKIIFKFSATIIKEITENLDSIGKWIPSEFVRKTRGLDELDRWKATELRLFLLYVGPIVLQKYLPEEYLVHFNSLHLAIRTLCHERECIDNNEYARDLLHYFVERSSTLYGKNFLIYNVHNLIHLSDDVLKFGHLDSFSAFSFENFLYSIKKLLRKGDKPLQQLHKRIVERAACGYTEEKRGFSKPEVANRNTKRSKKMECISYDTINYEKFKLSVKQTGDKFCYLKNDTIIRIKNIFLRNGQPVLLGETLMNTTELPHYPVNSLSLNVMVGDQWSKSKDFDANEVVTKAVCIPYRRSSCFMPLLHSSI